MISHTAVLLLIANVYLLNVRNGLFRDMVNIEIEIENLNRWVESLFIINICNKCIGID